jgi:hypothetical protein
VVEEVAGELAEADAAPPWLAHASDQNTMRWASVWLEIGMSAGTAWTATGSVCRSR